MLNLVKIISSSIDSSRRRLIKVLRMGKSDVQTSFAVHPYGVDSYPIKDMIGLYAQTGEKGKTVLIGYINKNQLADIGELRLFSTDADGALMTYLWLKNNGDMLLGGDGKHLARFEELKTGFDQLKTDFNSFVTLFNTHTHPASSGTTSPTLTQGTQTAASIDSSKTDKIKTS